MTRMVLGSLGSNVCRTPVPMAIPMGVTKAYAAEEFECKREFSKLGGREEDAHRTSRIASCAGL